MHGQEHFVENLGAVVNGAEMLDARGKSGGRKSTAENLVGHIKSGLTA